MTRFRPRNWYIGIGLAVAMLVAFGAGRATNSNVARYSVAVDGVHNELLIADHRTSELHKYNAWSWELLASIDLNSTGEKQLKRSSK